MMKTTKDNDGDTHLDAQQLKDAFTALGEFYAVVPAMMHSIDSDGRIIRVSDAWISTLGFDRHEVIGQLSSTFLTEESKTYARDVVLPKFFKEGRCDDVEYQMVCKDGRIIDVLLSGRLQRDEFGKALYSITVIRDVTDKRKLDRALMDSERRYRALFLHVQVAFALLELSDLGTTGAPLINFAAVNPAFLTLCGIDESALYEKCVDEILFGITMEAPACEAILREVALTGIGRELLELHGPEDRWFDLVSYSPGKRQCAILVQETTQRKRLQAAMNQQHEQIRVTLHSIGDAVISTDKDGVVRYLNPVAERLTGWSQELARGLFIEEVFQIFCENSRIRAKNPVERCLAEGHSIQMDDGIALVSKDGKRFSIEDSAAPIMSENGVISGVVLVFRDVTEQKRITSEVMFRATHDALTGLLNRAEFESSLHETLETSRSTRRRGAVLYVDLDQFKLVNDTCGHAAGDDLLKQVSILLEQSIGLPHTLARLGGDEFGIILPECSELESRETALHLCKQVDELRFEYEEHNFCVGASIGVVPLDDRWESGRAIMQTVDSACYAAKDAGRNRMHVWSETDKAVLARQDEMNWVRRLRRALDQNDFVLHAQEICALRGFPTRTRFEVLLRLRGEHGALILPGTFLPAAERFNIANRIDRWVVHNVFNWMGEHWEQVDHVESIAVNLSGQSIGDSAFHAYIAELLRRFPVAGRKLCFEVTETAAVTNLEAAADFVYTLRQFGARFALDDFGSGASSFGYLNSLPFDYLKIDGQFVRNMARDVLDRTVVKCVQEVAAALGKDTIAEFVETEEVATLLREMGVGGAQGFFLHRPEPMDVILTRRPSAHQWWTGAAQEQKRAP